MNQFVLIPQQLYDKKTKLAPQRLNRYNKKQNLVPKKLETV